MDTVQAILWSQIPITIAILIAAWQLWLIKNELLIILRKLTKK